MTFHHRRMILLAAVILAALSVTLAALHRAERPVSMAAAPISVGADTGERAYTVGIHGGYVAVFVPGKSEPVFITETRVALLPQADRDMLARGIDLASADALSAILEDYGS